MEFGILLTTTLVQLHSKILGPALLLSAQMGPKVHMECQFSMNAVSDGNFLNLDIYAQAMHSQVT